MSDTACVFDTVKFTMRINRVPGFISFSAPTFALQSLSLDKIMKLVSSVSRQPVLLLGCMRRQNKCVYFGILLLDRHVFDLATRCLKSEGSEWCCHLCGDTAVWGAVTSGITASLSVCADATRWWHWGDRSITLLPQPFLTCVAFLQLFNYFSYWNYWFPSFSALELFFECMMTAEDFGLVGMSNYCHCELTWKHIVVHWHRSAFTTRAWRQYSCAVLRTEPFVLYSGPAAFLFPCMAIPCLLWGGGGVSKTVNPTMTQSGLNAISSDLPALYFSCLDHSVIWNIKWCLFLRITVFFVQLHKQRNCLT